MELVLLHDDKIAVRYDVHDLVVGQVQSFNERCYLSQQAGVAYRLCLAVRLDTFLVKADSLEKFSTEISE